MGKNDWTEPDHQSCTCILAKGVLDNKQGTAILGFHRHSDLSVWNQRRLETTAAMDEGYGTAVCYKKRVGPGMQSQAAAVVHLD
jgi:hypothetical protein